MNYISRSSKWKVSTRLSDSPTRSRSCQWRTFAATQKLRELARVLEQRLPIAEVALTCEERLPIHEVVTQVKQFIKEAPPPDKLLAEIARTFIRK